MPESYKIKNHYIRLIQQDITDFEVEAFVFYARPNLELGSGFGSAITRRGGPAIKKELDAIGSIGQTKAVITSGGNMKAKYIVHAAGPAFQEEEIDSKLHTTINNALRCAEEKGIHQIALPPMGAGFYGIPLDTCARLMLNTLKEYFNNTSTLSEVIICANDGREYRAFQSVLKALS